MYFDDDGEDDNSDFDDDFGGDTDTAQGKSMMAEEDPSKLIDIELVNLLKFCNELKVKHQETDEYQEEVMMKSLELGKKTKEKTLILDMDETMIAAKFGTKECAGFKSNFEFSYMDAVIKVRFRPYLQDALEKLGTLYEIVAFTAGVKDYADPILD